MAYDRSAVKIHIQRGLEKHLQLHLLLGGGINVYIARPLSRSMNACTSGVNICHSIIQKEVLIFPQYLEFINCGYDILILD